MNDPRIRVLGGNAPTPEELAAVVIALTPVQVEDPQETGAPPWRRAAILEGLGRPPVNDAADLAGRRGWSS